MDLILWRHADAADGAPDMERALTDKGVRDAKRVAKWLNEHLPDDVLVLSSPARRARQTADALHRKIAVMDGIGTAAEPMDLLKAAGWPRAPHPVLVVGHQPTLGRVVSLLLTGAEGDISVRKGAAWWITARPRGGKVESVVRAVVAPDMLRKEGHV